MSRAPWLPSVAFFVGAAFVAVAAALPWAYIDGEPVGLAWIGVQAAVPAGVLALATLVAITSSTRRHWAVLATTLLGVFAGYSSLALARATPTIAGVRADADGSQGPAFVAILAAEAILTMTAWTTLVAERSRDIGHR